VAGSRFHPDPEFGSYNNSFRAECQNANWFISLQDAQENFDILKKDYNSFRPHSSLDDMSPNKNIEMHENIPDSLLMTST